MGRNYRSPGHGKVLSDSLLLAVVSTGRELKIHHYWGSWTCIVSRGAMPYHIYRRHHRICPVSCIHLIISWPWRRWQVHGGWSPVERRHRQHTPSRQCISLLAYRRSEISAPSLPMRDRNRTTVHQTRGKLRIIINDAVFGLLLVDACLRLGRWCIYVQGLASLTCNVCYTAFSVDQRWKMALSLLVVIRTLCCGLCGVEIVIGLAHDSGLLDRTDNLTGLCIVAVPTCFYFHGIVLKSGVIRLFIISNPYHCIVFSSVGRLWKLLRHIAVVCQDSSILVVECASNCSIGSLTVILLDFHIEFDSWIHFAYWFICYLFFDKPFF